MLFRCSNVVSCVSCMCIHMAAGNANVFNRTNFFRSWFFLTFSPAARVYSYVIEYNKNSRVAWMANTGGKPSEFNWQPCWCYGSSIYDDSLGTISNCIETIRKIISYGKHAVTTKLRRGLMFSARVIVLIFFLPCTRTYGINDMIIIVHIVCKHSYWCFRSHPLLESTGIVFTEFSRLRFAYISRSNYKILRYLSQRRNYRRSNIEHDVCRLAYLTENNLEILFRISPDRLKEREREREMYILWSIHFIFV